MVSIGILARNEGPRIPRTLESLFSQTLFTELALRREAAEIICVANACTDDTVEVARGVFARHTSAHPHREAFTGRAIDLAQPGKSNAWNRFVHDFSSPESRVLILMDADIQFHHPQTLWNLIAALMVEPEARAAVGRSIKDLALKERPGIRERISLATSRMTQGSGAQLSGQLYAIRADQARRIHLPREIIIDDGFIKHLLCTDHLRRPSDPSCLRQVPDASYVFEAYVTARDVIKNQKRQMIGQTIMHVLVDRHLPALLTDPHADLAAIIRQCDQTDPGWVRRLLIAHVREVRHFWRLFPGILTFRFRRLARQPGLGKLRHFPAALAGWVVTLLACWMACRALRRGQLQYWPDKLPAASSPLPSSPPAELAAG